ncbi:MAG: hypothetical protein OXG92_07815 [Chloroflexi bacterium]|nr:hypothetical protein [Chloroflexota bacterium]MCY3583301.1 hypothetical protein [Chloroflexota bacterium]MCY3716358.1 hypothetical protein [Chloroflexota bacterium]MDE2649442.1 hypothetical protein [Chloroflexota bacterium]MXX51576.1 hypothetical protein [Chloroflexota bacterium]
MADIGQDHERRISTIEGEMKSLATKADLAEFKAEIIQYVQNAIQSAFQAQSEELQPTLDRILTTLERQSDEIRELREKESRFRGAVDALKYALPFLISVIAVIVAIMN